MESETSESLDHRAVALEWAKHTIPERQDVPAEILDDAECASFHLSRIEDRLVEMGIVGSAAAGELVVTHFGEDYFRENVLPDLKAMCGELDPHPFDTGRTLAYVNGLPFNFYNRPRRETITVRPSRVARPITMKAKE